ncbi:type III secretion system inner membrane ring subunit SctD [Ottowia thiooxydans]
MREALVLELRVLSGRHAGASAIARPGLSVGIVDEADIILTDLDYAAGLARLHLRGDSHWLLTSADLDPDEQAWTDAPRIGDPGYWGGLALCVSPSHADWPKLPAAKLAPSLGVEAQADDTGSGAGSLQPLSGDDEPQFEPATALIAAPGEARPATRSGMRAVLWVGAAIFLILAALGLAALISERWAREPQTQPKVSEAVGVDLTEQAQGQISELKLVIARVDPALRLQFTPQKDGQVRVSGWVESVAQLDRLADALGSRRPAPLMRVLVANDVQTELRAQLAGSYPHIDFSAGDPGKVRIRGIVLTQAARAEVLSAVRPLLPAGLELDDSLRLAETMAPDVRSALGAAGFNDAKARWDGSQIVATLSLPDGARVRFENTLLALAERFPGLPLRVMPQTVVVASLSDRGKAPFPIRSVVGGDVPYLILQGGDKLLPGGAYAGWRLQSIEPDVLVFDSPRRLVVAR